jgi:hypothetical protein
MVLCFHKRGMVENIFRAHAYAGLTYHCVRSYTRAKACARKSGYFPRVLGVFLMLGGFAYMIDFFIFFLLPSYEGVILSVFEVFGLSEITFGIWLVVKGVRVKVQS